MRKLIMWNLITLDGYFQGEKDWDLGFHQLVWGKELESISIEQLKTAGMLVFGETTYKGMADYWSKENEEGPEGETAKYMNALPKAVCSRTLEKADWNNTTIVKDAVAEIPKLKQEGKGRRLFNSGLNYQKLTLLETKQLSSGGIILTYAPASK